MYRPIPGWRPASPPITASNYALVSGAHRIVAIHFWAKWNGLDPPFDAVIPAMPEQIKASVHFVSCDVDDPQNEPVWTKFALANIPYLGLLVVGKPAGGIMGLRNREELESELLTRLYPPLPTDQPRDK